MIIPAAIAAVISISTAAIAAVIVIIIISIIVNSFLAWDNVWLRFGLKILTIPVIASGGAGTMEDFKKAFEAGADAALAASVFHFGEIPIPDLKKYLAKEGIPIRPAE